MPEYVITFFNFNFDFFIYCYSVLSDFTGLADAALIV